MQFRAEALNLTNTPHFSNPGASVSSLSLNPDGTVKSSGRVHHDNRHQRGKPVDRRTVPAVRPADLILMGQRLRTRFLAGLAG